VATPRRATCFGVLIALRTGSLGMLRALRVEVLSCAARETAARRPCASWSRSCREKRIPISIARHFSPENLIAYRPG